MIDLAVKKRSNQADISKGKLSRKDVFVVANWKMCQDWSGARAWINQMAAMLGYLTDKKFFLPKIVLCPPAVYIAPLAQHIQDHQVQHISLGGQDCHVQSKGAHTGDISAAMLADIGCEYVIIGHSERRQAYGEAGDIITSKIAAARAHGLRPIVCVGESSTIRQADQTLDVIERQLDDLPSTPDDIIVAYEPVWAIGSGMVPSSAQISKVHNAIKQSLAVPVLYGGSVSPTTAPAILGLDNVDGGLVGGASLVAAEFGAIIEASMLEVKARPQVNAAD